MVLRTHGNQSAVSVSKSSPTDLNLLMHGSVFAWLLQSHVPVHRKTDDKQASKNPERQRVSLLVQHLPEVTDITEDSLLTRTSFVFHYRGVCKWKAIAQWFSTCGSQLFGVWIPNSCISYIYMIHSTSKTTVMK